VADRYRRRPIEVEAMGPLDHENGDEIAAWCGGIYSRSLDCILIEPRHHRQLKVPFGHVLVLTPMHQPNQGVHMEIHSPEEFEALYEKAEVEPDG
jgi:hypothetical protein